MAMAFENNAQASAQCCSFIMFSPQTITIQYKEAQRHTLNAIHTGADKIILTLVLGTSSWAGRVVV
jgi:hypothetical protein